MKKMKKMKKETQKRMCLRCLKQFDSTGLGNRICTKCKKIEMIVNNKPNLAKNRMSADEYKEYLFNKKRKKNKQLKYNNISVVFAGKSFDSTGEFERWQKLKFLEAQKIISNLQTQVKYLLIPAQIDEQGNKIRATHYIADFVYFNGKRQIVEDYKGFKTSQYKLKKKLMLQKYGITILETKNKKK